MAGAAQGGRTLRAGCMASRSPRELVGTGVQNLRAYEARGLLEPERTEGGTRRYSANDLDRLRRIGDLLAAGLNLAGIAMVMDLQEENQQLLGYKEEQQRKPPAPTKTAPTNTASTPATRSPRRKSSNSRPGPTPG